MQTLAAAARQTHRDLSESDDKRKLLVLDDGHHELTLVPNDDRATHRLRVCTPRRTGYLKGRHTAGLRPQPARW